MKNNEINKFSNNENKIKNAPKKKNFKRKSHIEIDIKKKDKASSKSTINRKSISVSKKINSLLTLNIEDNPNHKDIKKNTSNENNIMAYNDYELNTMNFDDALKYDKRTYIQYYLSLIRTKHLLLFAILPSNDYNSKITKICLFLFSFSLYYCTHALFFTDNTVHIIYEDEGKFNFIYQLPQILYSSIISSLVSMIIRFLSLSEKNVINFKNSLGKNSNEDRDKLLKILRIKFIWFFNISFAFLIFFWYYLSCFCVIYKNSHIHLLKDTLISFSFSLIYPFGLYLISGIFRISSLKNKNSCLYKINKIIQMI